MAAQQQMNPNAMADDATTTLPPARRLAQGLAALRILVGLIFLAPVLPARAR